MGNERAVIDDDDDEELKFGQTGQGVGPAVQTVRIARA